MLQFGATINSTLPWNDQTGGEKWKVQCAPYGMVESPSDWSAYRDCCMDKMRWQDDQGSYRLRRIPERHLWKIEDDTGRLRGAVVVYVDNLFVAAEETKIGGVFDAIKRMWQCSQEERVTEDSWMRFCGYEVKKTKDGVMIAQPGYTEDLLRRRQVEGTEECPCPKVDDREDEENGDGCFPRETQAVTRELMLLSGRTRPDISYAVGLMSGLLQATRLCVQHWKSRVKVLECHQEFWIGVLLLAL